LPEEIENCRPYFLKELELLKNIQVIVPLGQIAFAQTLRSLRLKGVEIPSLPFGHGKVYEVFTGEVLRTPIGNGLKPFPIERRPITLITTYHPSQQNTRTGKLTRPMFERIFRIARQRL